MDETLARASSARAFRFLTDVDRAVQYNYVIDPALDGGNMLLGANAAGAQPGITTAIYARLVAARQKSDGHWDTLDVRPPQSYSTVTATAIASRALQIYAHQVLRQRRSLVSIRREPGLMSAPAPLTEDRVMK